MPRKGFTGKQPSACAKLGASAIVAAAWVAMLAPDLRAQEAPVPVEKLAELSLEDLLKIKITTASLRPQEVREVPATAYVVTEEDFRAYGYRDLKDILRNLPGVDYVWPGSHLYGGQRGFSSFWELTKLLINGREANAMVGDAAFIVNQFSLTGVERVEIVQGPASVLYGPEAFSGVINIITKDADNSPEESEVAGLAGGGDDRSRYGSGAFHTVSRSGPIAFALGGYVDGGRGQDFTDFLKSPQYAEANRERRTFLLENGSPYRNTIRDQRFSADLAYSPMSDVQIKAGALYVRTEQGGGIEANQLVYNSTNSILEQAHFHASGEYLFAVVPVKATLAAHHTGENFWNRFPSPVAVDSGPPFLATSNFEDTRLDVVNLQIDYFPSFIDNYLLAGVGVRDTRVGEPATTGLFPTDTLPGQSTPLVGRALFPATGAFANLRPVLHQNRLYAYVQDQQSFWNRRIQITAGLRFDRNNIYGNILNLRSGILLRPHPNYTFRGLFGQGFREPTVFDLVNADIEPARMNTWEASFLFTPVRHLSGQVAYYHNLASDLIVLAAAPGTPSGFLPQNVGTKEVGGIESLIRYQVGPFAGDIWHSHEFSLDGQPLFGTPEDKLGFGGNYGYGNHLSFGLRTKYTSRAEGRSQDAAGSPLTIKMPRYLSLDVNALARELEFAGGRWEVSFSILNILDRQNLYPNTLGANPSRYLAEGREYFGKIAVRY